MARESNVNKFAIAEPSFCLQQNILRVGLKQTYAFNWDLI